MRIAFSAILFLALLIPGLLFYVAYRYDQDTDGIPVKFPPQKIVAVSLLSSGLHLLFFLITLPIQYCLGRYVDGGLILELIIGSEIEPQVIQQQIWESANLIVVYFGVLFGCAWMSGNLAWEAVWRNQLDFKYQFLRRNPLFYLLTGHDAIRQSEHFPDKNLGVMVTITALVKAGDLNFLYSGYYGGAEIDSEQRIIFLILGYPDRRTVHSDEELYRYPLEHNEKGDLVDPNPPYPRYPIEGDFLIIDGEDILNVCFNYDVYREVRKNNEELTWSGRVSHLKSQLRLTYWAKAASWLLFLFSPAAFIPGLVKLSTGDDDLTSSILLCSGILAFIASLLLEIRVRSS